MALLEAGRRRDTEGLAQALSHAEKACVSGDLISHARIKLVQVEEYVRRWQATSQAERNLLDLVRSDSDAVTLATALETAREAGVSRSVIDCAWKRKVALEAAAWK